MAPDTCTAVNGPTFDVGEMRAVAGQAATLLRALGNEDRLLVLCQLSQGALSVSEIEAQTGVRQPTLSQQLAVLRAERLVQTRREGKRIYYSVTDPKALSVLTTLYQLFCASRPHAG